MGRKLVTNQAERRMGGSPHKRQKVSWPEIWELDEESEEWTGVEARNRLELSGLERVSWEIAHTLEDLVVEVGELQKSVMRQESLQQEQVEQGAVIADMVELFGHGEHFLRMRKMGMLEKPEMELPIKKIGSQKVTGKGKEPERGPEENLEVEGQDVEMTLQ